MEGRSEREERSGEDGKEQKSSIQGARRERGGVICWRSPSSNITGVYISREQANPSLIRL